MAIFIDEKNKTFVLSGKTFTYAFDVNYEILRHLYFGKKIANEGISQFVGDKKEGCMMDFYYEGKRIAATFDTLTQEYTGNKIGDFRSNSMSAKRPDGSNVVYLKYRSHEVLKSLPKLTSMPSFSGGETLVVTLCDDFSGLLVHLYYTVNEESDTLLRRTVFENKGSEPLVLDKAASFCVDFQDKDLVMQTYYGRHAQERQIETSEITHNRTIIESIRGTTSHQKNPFVTLMSRNATEEEGEVYGFSLCYSANYEFTVEKDSFNQIRIDGGLNPRAFAWRLDVGETFETPQAIIAYSNKGLGQMSRNLHDMVRKHLMNGFAEKSRPVVVNSWEAMYFDLDEQKLIALINKSGGTGIDTFVLDDGWFGHRDSDNSSLGDWYVDKKKFPRGLKPVIDACHKNGLKFGIWIEPEMVNPDSELYARHPEWAVQVEGREPTLSRTQFNLDMTRREVIDYLKETFDKLLTENEIDYVKWDMNRNIVENHSLNLTGDREGEFCHRYMLGVYELAKYLTEKYNEIIFEGCCGGGGRFDYGMLAYFPQIWASDNTDADERTRIQYSTSIMYPMSAISSHVSKAPNGETHRVHTIEARGDVASCGTLGYELNFNEMPKEDYEMVKEQVARYKKYEDVMLSGDLYRLANPYTGNFFGMEMLAKDKSRGYAVYYLRQVTQGQTIKCVRFSGLDENTTYHIFGGKFDFTAKGSVFMNVGIQFPKVKQDWYSIFFEIERV